MPDTTAPGPYRLVVVDPAGGRLLVHTHQTADEAWTELQDHLRIVNTVPNLRGWYAPDTGRRLIVTGPDHAVMPRSFETVAGA